MPLSASELHRRGVEAANARRFAAARRALTAASARTDDADLLARIDGTLAYVLGQTGEPAAAERLTRDALSRAGLDRGTVAILSGQLGTLLMHSGSLDEAARMLADAIAAFPSDSIELANCLMNRSLVSMQRHELVPCTADLERAIAIYELLGADEPRAEAQHNLGYAALLGGDLVTALALMTAARPTLAAASDLAAAISDLDRAEVLRDAGETSEAEALLRATAARFGAQRMRQARGEAEFHLARSLLRHDPDAAATAAASATRRFTALGSTGWAARAQAIRLEALVRGASRRVPPIAGFVDIIAALDEGGFRTESLALSLTARSVDGGRIPRLTDDAPTPLRLRAAEVRAERAASTGRHADARRIAAEGLDLLTAWQQSFGALDLQASAAMHGTALMFTGLASAARTRDPAVLFEWSERARHLSQQIAPLRPPHDPELATDLAELRMLRADRAGQDWTNDPDVLVLRDRVRERQWSATGVAGLRKQRTLAEATAQLDADTAVLSYVFTGSALHGVVVGAAGAHALELSWERVQRALDGLRADLDVSALALGGPMAATIQRSLDARLSALDAELLAPLRPPSATRLVITVPGVLAGIPWSMLPSLTSTPFTLATSVSRWLDDRRAPHAATRPPRTDARTGRSEGASAESGTRVGFAVGPRVPRGAEEVARAAASWTAAETLTGNDAHVASVTGLAGRSDILHVAAHGRHTVDNPMFSGLELVDGTLFGYDVDLIERLPQTVILSACELGRSSVRWGEEALGMTRVWLHAGTRSVIAAPVTVPDAIAAELLSAVHAGLSAGEAPAVALAAARATTGLRTPFQVHGSGL